MKMVLGTLVAGLFVNFAYAGGVPSFPPSETTFVDCEDTEQGLTLFQREGGLYLGIDAKTPFALGVIAEGYVVKGYAPEGFGQHPLSITLNDILLSTEAPVSSRPFTTNLEPNRILNNAVYALAPLTEAQGRRLKTSIKSKAVAGGTAIEVIFQQELLPEYVCTGQPPSNPFEGCEPMVVAQEGELVSQTSVQLTLDKCEISKH